MTDGTLFSPAVFAVLGAELFFALAFPAAMLILWRVKTHAKMIPALAGALTFCVVCLLMEQGLHALFLTGIPSVSAFLLSNPVYYGVYAGMTAGILEETARYFVFRTALKNRQTRDVPVTYGLGYGAIECVMLFAITIASNLMIAATFNDLGADAFAEQFAPGNRAELLAAVAEINALDIPAAIFACLERAVSAALHVELTLYVFAAIRLDRFLLYPTAVVIHFAASFFLALQQAGALSVPYLSLIVLVAVAASMALPARRLYRQIPDGEAPRLDRFGRSLL